MRRTTLRMLPLVSAALLFVAVASAPAAAQTPKPVELSNIKVFFKLEGETTFQPTDPADPVVPSTTEVLRFTATVVGHKEGDKILIQATVHEKCAPASANPHLSKLRALSETVSQIVSVSDRGEISVDVLVHCASCEEAVCHRRCPERTHLGEGPGTGSLTVEDVTDLRRARDRRTAGEMVAPGAGLFLYDFRSVCPTPPPRRTN